MAGPRISHFYYSQHARLHVILVTMENEFKKYKVANRRQDVVIVILDTDMKVELRLTKVFAIFCTFVLPASEKIGIIVSPQMA